MRRMMLEGTVAVAITALLLVPNLEAQQSIDETRPLERNGTMEVRVVSHDLRIVPWDRAEIRIQGSYDPEWEELDIRGNGRAVRVEVRHLRNRRGSWGTGSRTLELRVPAGARVDLGTVSGSVEGSELRGALAVATVSGGIRLRDLDAGVASLNTVSGSLEVGGRASEVRANTVSGRVAVEVDAPVVMAKSVSGRVGVSSRTPLERVEMSAVSGQITFSGALAPGGDLHAESHSGGVELTLNRDVDARFHLSTFSGSIRTDLEGRDRREERSRFAPGETVTFIIGSGAGRVEARSFSGTVRVRGGGG